MTESWIEGTMQNLHLAGEDDDEMYSGYNDYNPFFDTEVRNTCMFKYYGLYSELQFNLNCSLSIV